MGEIIGSLADMSAVLGNIRAATEIRKGNKITKVIVVSSGLIVGVLLTLVL